MRERVIVVTLSVCLCVTFVFAPFSGLKLTSVHSRDDLSPLTAAKKLNYFGENTTGTSAVTAVIYAGTAQSLTLLTSKACILYTPSSAPSGVAPLVLLG